MPVNVDSGLIRSPQNVYTEYPGPRRDEWETKIRPALRKISISQIERISHPRKQSLAMRCLELTVVQLEEAKHFIQTDRIPHLRLALMLRDGAAEALMHPRLPRPGSDGGIRFPRLKETEGTGHKVVRKRGR